MKTRFAAVKGLRKNFFKAQLPDVYRNDNYIACYNFCYQCRNHFTIARVKKLNHIFFATFFL